MRREGVVAELRVAVERQVVGDEVHPGLDQRRHAGGSWKPVSGCAAAPSQNRPWWTRIASAPASRARSNSSRQAETPVDDLADLAPCPRPAGRWGRSPGPPSRRAAGRSSRRGSRSSMAWFALRSQEGHRRSGKRAGLAARPLRPDTTLERCGPPAAASAASPPRPPRRRTALAAPATARRRRRGRRGRRRARPGRRRGSAPPPAPAGSPMPSYWAGS